MIFKKRECVVCRCLKVSISTEHYVNVNVCEKLDLKVTFAF